MRDRVRDSDEGGQGIGKGKPIAEKGIGHGIAVLERF